MIRAELWSEVIAPLMGGILRFRSLLGGTRLLYFLCGLVLGLATPWTRTL